MWKCICLSLGFCSFRASLFFCWSNVQRILFGLFLPNIYWLVFGSVFSLAINRADILASLGFPCFSATHLSVDFSSSKSDHLQFHNSPILNPVSFSAWSVIETFLLVPEISASISFSVGTNGKVSFFL